MNLRDKVEETLKLCEIVEQQDRLYQESATRQEEEYSAILGNTVEVGAKAWAVVGKPIVVCKDTLGFDRDKDAEHYKEKGIHVYGDGPRIALGGYEGEDLFVTASGKLLLLTYGREGGNAGVGFGSTWRGSPKLLTAKQTVKHFKETKKISPPVFVEQIVEKLLDLVRRQAGGNKSKRTAERDSTTVILESVANLIAMAMIKGKK